MTSAPKGKGRRLGGGPATPSTLDDPTPPEAPGQQIVPAPETHPAPAPRPAAAVAEPQQGPVRLVEQPPAPPTAAPRTGRPSAAELLQPREEIRREQISVMVPEQLQLRKRMRRYWVDQEVEVRDQAAFALDAWLTEQGY